MSWVRTVDIDYQQVSYLSQQVTVKRIDKVHEFISGNKFYKLKYNLQYAQEQGYRQIVSFGGAYSNHIYALAHACHEQGLDNIAIIRGDELAHKPLNHTLSQVQALGTQLVFISRQQYRNKHTAEFLSHLRQTYPNAYIIPEGGSNELAIKGTAEIISEEDKENFSHICCAVGTGGTIAGIINASSAQQQVIGFSALNTTYQADDINKWTNKANWSLYADDVFGGYARYDQRLINFIEAMKHQHDLPLEPIYTGKALYRLLHWLEESWLEKKQELGKNKGLAEQANSPQSACNRPLSKLNLPRPLFIKEGRSPPFSKGDLGGFAEAHSKLSLLTGFRKRSKVLFIHSGGLQGYHVGASTGVNSVLNS